MDTDLFDELVQSLNEAKTIAKGEAQASRRFELPAPDAKAEAFDELRTVCAEDNYNLDLAPRRDRSNAFTELLD